MRKQLIHNWRSFIRASVIIAVAFVLLSVLRDGQIEELAVGNTNQSSDSKSADNRLALLTAADPTQIWDVEQQRLYADLMRVLGDDRPLLLWLQNGGDARPSDIAFFREQGQAAIQRRDYANARQSLEAILALNPQDTAANYQLGLLLLVDDPEQARFYLSNAVIDPQFQTSAQQLQESLARDPDDIYTLAEILFDHEEWIFAESLLSLTIQDTPLDYVSYAYRGYVRDQLGQDPLSDFEAALGLAPESPLPYYFLGLYWRGRGNWDDAVLAFSEAYFLDPTNAALALDVAQTYYQGGKLDEAAQWFDVVISLDSENEEWHRQRSAFYAETQFNLEQVGIRQIQVSQSLFPQNAHILASLGHANYWLGNYEVARAQLQAAIDLAPEAPRSHYFLGQVKESQGDRIAAIEAYSEALRLADAASAYDALASRALSRMGVTP